MKNFISIFATEAMGIQPEREDHPSRTLKAIEEVSAAKAREGARMAVNDMVEMCEASTAEYVARLDAHLAANDAMTLSEARLKFSRTLKSIMKRGIRNEVEYYLVRNAVEAADPETATTLWNMLTAFEGESAR